jgi:thiosulfate/3-mercaptopyruvate sulfurtransferase
MSRSDYANPEVLVETSWVEEHLKDPAIRIVEVDYDPVPNYNQGHVPGAVLWDWKKDLNDPVTRDILNADQLRQLLERSGVGDHTAVVLYGDFNNWFAAYAFWDLNYYGVNNVRLMNGGRKAWLLEDRPLSKEVPSYPRSAYTLPLRQDDTLRAFMDYVRHAIKMEDKVLVDVRSPKEYTGEITAPPEYPNEAAQRGGHIPRAVNIPWAQAVNDSDGRFKPRKELEQLYRSKGVVPEKEVITYCRIGERSSHTWFVLRYLLGYPNVKNYDGSWTEWGNTLRNPIEK